MSRIAIIGGGIGGVSLARALTEQGGHEITLFEKGRGVGGRMATRRADPFRFDHGAQCFTIRTPEFAALLNPLIEAGVVAEWQGPVVNIEGGRVTSDRVWVERHFVGAPDMNRLAHFWAEGLNVRTGIEVAPLDARSGEAWHLADLAGTPLGTFDLVFSTTTPHQTLALFGPYGPTDAPINACSMKPCYALMLGFNRPVAPEWIAAKVQDGPVRWISVNSSKPGRDKSQTTFVVHARSGWSNTRLEQDPAETQALMAAAFLTATGIDPAAADYATLHRWKSALVRRSPKPGPWWNSALGLGATGDWALSSRIEDVVLMARSLARKVG